MPEQTDLLIVGAGPAGGALACFLASYGLKGILIAATPSTADTPRAHITNMAALECLRDIGLEQECLKVATSSSNMEHTRWCYSMTGEEFGRIYSWGHDPKRHGDYDAASPCSHVDLPQTLLEPILINRAKQSGWDVRFNTTLTSFTEKAQDQIISEVKDSVSGQTYSIQSKYLFGCDGARSQVMRQLNLPLIKKPGGGLAYNVLTKVDLSEYVKTRVGNLHWTIQPDREAPPYAWMAVIRMVRPWNEWMFIFLTKPDYDSSTSGEPTMQDWEREVGIQIGQDEVPFEITNVSKWAINETVAETYSRGNVFCLGDAVHRHPPFNGLGSNTCIQDAYNLAWKIAYTLSSQASPSLLDTYSPERQPVGLSVVTRANKGFREHLHVWNALAVTEPLLSKRQDLFAELSHATPAGRQRRKHLQTAIANTSHEFHAVGQEMNQRYESAAVYTGDQGPRPPLPGDPVLQHQLSTYPGARLPHAWLNTRVPTKQLSTIDLAGHGAFCLITGIGGAAWREAAAHATQKLGVTVNVYSVGWRQDYEDVYSDWARRREVEEDGCVLVRPDRFVCWRSMEMVERPGERLVEVLRSVLGRDGDNGTNGVDGVEGSR